MSFFRLVAVAVTVISLVRSCDAVAEDKLPLPVLSDSLRAELSGYLQVHRQTPEEYVISKFRDHDVIILGEQHRVLHDPMLVQTLIPMLYKQGIYTLGFEFARRIDQPLIDSLLDGKTYDQPLTNEILLRQFVHWGYQEYADIFKAAWQVNQRL
ncbi:MAG: ChaN family lipoprotein, partial [candidate division Zixibacteria bacterium]|nr:ChaN family lipoprotein [candidate division Zixibacteria bacterium]